MTLPLPIVDRPAPEIPLRHLDHLWFQVGGTLCNLECTHCFISCSPRNHNFGFLDLAAVTRHLRESAALGVKEYYFTGGEPFLNPDMTAILEATLQFGPATVLTNGTILKPEWLERLARAEQASLYSLEFRVSIDGASPEINDPIRGTGTFRRAMAGVQRLVEHGFLPLITATRTRDDQNDIDLVRDFSQALREIGYDRPRIKILPTLRIGAEAGRQRGYRDEEYVSPEMMHGFDPSLLVCHSSRIVTDRGVHVCPILIEAPGSRLGESLLESLRPFPLKYHACFTCYQYGTLCSNPSSGGRDA